MNAIIKETVLFSLIIVIVESLYLEYPLECGFSTFTFLPLGIKKQLWKQK